MPEPVFPSPEAAEAAFYAAFEARDLDAMMAVWASDESIACIHPLASPLNGQGPVRAGWRSIFEAAEQFRVHVDAFHELRDTAQVIRIVKEHLVIGEETAARPPILATNVFRRQGEGWRMVLHHASPLKVGDTAPARPVSQVLH
jgi:ketosteroid isomerase-like protein